ncbi:MAG: RNA-binding protein [Euryarchaeota archaeon]|nr:RNA-binding protein [Euryarchaeota archaeon]
MGIHTRSRHYLRSSDAKKILKELGKAFDPSDIGDVFKGKRFELVTTDVCDIILVEDVPMIFMPDGEPFLTVRGALEVKPEVRIVVVDAGATRFVVNGADVMRPGIVQVDPDIQEGDLVIVIEEAHRKALAIGRALIPGDEMIGDSGKAIKTLHYVGDTIWEVTR